MSVYFYGCISIDGYLADKNHRLDWLHESGSIEETSYQDFYNQMDITIMGKKTFDSIENIEKIEDYYKTTTNYVFTHSSSLSLESFIPVNENILNFVKKIDSDKNIWIVGGNTLLAPLLDNDMIDYMIIQVAPVLLGDGISLFTQKEIVKRFYLDNVNKYGQFAELVYKKIK